MEFRWIGHHELALLVENRGRDGGLVRHLAELALRSARPAGGSEPHATVFLHATAAAGEELRATWDPAMAWQIAAHVVEEMVAELSITAFDGRCWQVAATGGGLRACERLRRRRGW